MATAIAIVRLRDLFAVVMLAGLYSLLSAAIFVILDAVDVAFTEAAVGAGITTVLMLGTLVLTDREEKQPKKNSLWPLAVVVVTGAALIYGTLDMPGFGDPNTPANKHVAPQYLADKVPQNPSGDPVTVGIPNIVTTILASYRGYDTLGEVAVIFTAGIGVLLLLGSPARNENPAPSEQRKPRRRPRPPRPRSRTPERPGSRSPRSRPRPPRSPRPPSRGRSPPIWSWPFGAAITNDRSPRPETGESSTAL